MWNFQVFNFRLTKAETKAKANFEWNERQSQKPQQKLQPQKIATIVELAGVEEEEV